MTNPTTVFFVAGVQFTKYKDFAHHIAGGDSLVLKHNPLNPYDNKAIELHWVAPDISLHMIGHVPKDNPEKGNTAQGDLFNWHKLGGKNFVAKVLNHFPSNKMWQCLQVVVTCDLNTDVTDFVDFSI